MNFIETKLPGVFLIEPKIFGDNRGYFFESYRASHFEDRGFESHFVQVNRSSSMKGVLRGLHFQHPHPQGKLVSVLSGEVFDVAVDINPTSPTFGQWVGEIISAEKKNMLWVAPGYAHGFYVLSEIAEFSYNCTDYYHPEAEASIIWNDPDLNIAWPIPEGELPVLSSKDMNGMSLAEYKETCLKQHS